jgi:hypothetical protein
MQAKAEHTTIDETLSHLKAVENRWLLAQITDSTLHPIVWLIFIGLLGLAWLIQPGKVDSTLGVALLMFLRFVIGFIVLGSLWGRVGAGMLVGICLFFLLMCMNSLSILMWDAPLSTITNQIQHAEWLANALFVFGLIGLVACAAMTLALRSGRLQLSRRFVRLSLQSLTTLQIILLVELGYTGLAYATKLDQRDIPIAQSSVRSDFRHHIPSANGPLDRPAHEKATAPNRPG